MSYQDKDIVQNALPIELKFSFVSSAVWVLLVRVLEEMEGQLFMEAGRKPLRDDDSVQTDTVTRISRSTVNTSGRHSQKAGQQAK